MVIFAFLTPITLLCALLLMHGVETWVDRVPVGRRASRTTAFQEGVVRQRLGERQPAPAAHRVRRAHRAPARLEPPGDGS